MTLLTPREAALLLGVTQATLRVWEERFGYPAPATFPSGSPGYAYGDVVALRNALDRQLSIVTAIGAARRSAPGPGPLRSLVPAGSPGPGSGERELCRPPRASAREIDEPATERQR